MTAIEFIALIYRSDIKRVVRYETVFSNKHSIKAFQNAEGNEFY